MVDKRLLLFLFTFTIFIKPTVGVGAIYFSAEEDQRPQGFVDEVIQKLPSTMYEVIANKNILLKFSSEAENKSIKQDCSFRFLNKFDSMPPKYVELKYRHKNIILLLNKSFKKVIVNNDMTDSYPCNHQNTYRLAQASLINGLGQIYLSTLNDTPINKQFENIIYMKNTMNERRIDPREAKSLNDAFLVNLEYFLLDPEYGCRLPLNYSYMSRHFQYSPFKDRSCRVNTKIPLRKANLMDNSFEFRDISPERIYQIRVLTATKGAGLESRWGHSMFELIACSNQQSPNSSCVINQSQHVVLSFAAKTEDSTNPIEKNLKGLLGYFPMQLSFSRLSDVINEYNRTEYRDLISLPLNANKITNEDFIYGALQRYWAVRGNYYFLTNNCASEANSLLKAVSNDLQIHKIRALTPVGLHNKWMENQIIDQSQIDLKYIGVRDSYQIKSNYEYLESALNFLKKLIMQIGKDSQIFSTLQHYGKNSSASERQNIYNFLNEAVRSTSISQKNLAEMFYYLEENNLVLIRKEINDKLSVMLKNTGKNNPMYNTFPHQVLAAFQKLQSREQSIFAIKPGYGIPLESDFLFSSTELENESADIAYQKMALLGQLIQYFPEEQAAFKESKLAKDFFFQQWNSKYVVDIPQTK